MQVLLIITLVLGGLGLLLAMPGGRLSFGRAALLVLAGAGAALLGLLLPALPGPINQYSFAGAAVIALWGAIRVITHKVPVYSALHFILVIVATATMLVLMQAEFVALALIIIYGGAILVTYVFVIMLASHSGPPARYDLQARDPVIGIVCGFILLALLSARFLNPQIAPTPLPSEILGVAGPDFRGTVANVGTNLLTNYVVAVQVAGVLLLAALVGAVAIARRRAYQDSLAEETL